MKRLPPFFRFALVGAAATVVDLAITLALLPMVPHLLWANSAGFLVANLLQFTMVHHFVFDSATRHTWLEAYMASLGISMLGLALSNLLVYLMVEVVGWGVPIAKLLVAFITLGYNYCLRRMLLYTGST